MEVSVDDVEWEDYKFQVRGVPGKSVTMKEVAFASYTNPAPGEQPGLEATFYYDPPNLTFPYGAYIAVVDIDKETGETKVRRFLAIDDCGNVINPMIVEGQIHGGLTEGFAIAFMQEIVYDAQGNNLNTNFTDYLVPTALETPKWETDSTCTPSPHHPIGAKGVGESPNVGSPAAFVNAVIDALAPYNVRNIDMPLTREKVWRAIHATHEQHLYRPGSDPGAQRQGLGLHQRRPQYLRLPARHHRDDVYRRSQLHVDRGHRGRAGAGEVQVHDRAGTP